MDSNRKPGQVDLDELDYQPEEVSAFADQNRGEEYKFYSGSKDE